MYKLLLALAISNKIMSFVTLKKRSHCYNCSTQRSFVDVEFSLKAQMVNYTCLVKFWSLLKLRFIKIRQIQINTKLQIED